MFIIQATGVVMLSTVHAEYVVMVSVILLKVVVLNVVMPSVHSECDK
jgi:hypothetical protein